MIVERLWRLTRAPYAELRGEGARLYGGRWSPIGTSVVYASTSLALAVLEALVHTDPDLIPDDLMAMEIEAAGLSIEAPAVDDLPPRWRVEIGRVETQAFGGGWVDERRSALLLLPSVLLPVEAAEAEANVLFNPAHPEAARFRILRQLPFTLDPRLLAG